MANQEHLDILKQGVEVWNKWRSEHRNLRPDLNGADLSKTFLTETNLSGANLTERELNVIRAILRKKEQSLTPANFKEEDLNMLRLLFHRRGANPNEPGLSEVGLSEAELQALDHMVCGPP